MLDADCTLDSQSLRVLDAFLQSGARVLQANHRVINLDATPISFAAAVGRRLEYGLFFAPKSCFRLAVLLVGSGMVLHRSVLQQCPWSSHSCTEDTEYTIRLAQQHEPVCFAAEAWLRRAGGRDARAVAGPTQPLGSGKPGTRQVGSLRLIGSGLGRRNLLLADLGITLLLLSRPLVLAHLAATLVAGVLLTVVVPGPRSSMLLAASLGVLMGHGLYLAIGILSVGLTPNRAMLLLRAPAVVARLALISFAALLRSGPGSWHRTPRD